MTAEPSDIVGRWIAAHPDPRLAFTTTATDIAPGSDIGKPRLCCICGERLGFGRYDAHSGGGNHATCDRHRLPAGGTPDKALGRQAYEALLAQEGVN